MSTHTLTKADEAPGMRIARNLDLVVLLIALPIFLAAGFSMLGFVTGAGAWLVQRAVRAYLARRAERSEDPRTIVGLLVGSMIGRGWLVAGIIIAVGVGHSKAGLAAAVLFLTVFTVSFTMNLIFRPVEPKPARAERVKPTRAFERPEAVRHDGKRGFEQQETARPGFERPEAIQPQAKP